MSRSRFVASRQRRHGVKRLCRVIGFARSNCYRWKTTAPDRAARTVADARLAARIRTIHRDSTGTYGVPRITAELRDAGRVVNHKRVARVMRGIGLAAFGRLHRHNTRRRHCYLGQMFPIDYENSLSSTPATLTHAASPVSNIRVKVQPL